MITETDRLKLLRQAKQILQDNWRGTHTVPSPTLYPHQWSWDSAFISIGYARYDQNRAQKELLSMFEGQWSNGMLPSIVFRSRDDYFPGPDYWESERSEHAPGIKTSGITQPAVHAIAALEIYRHAQDRKKAKSFLEGLFPRLMSFHRYLLTKRDPEKTGLVTIFHPWESGLDNSIRWDEPMSRIRVDPSREIRRVDDKKVSPEQRPGDSDYQIYIYLADIMKVHDYDEDSFYKSFPFKLKDIVFSSILYTANKAMLEIADIIRESDNEVMSWLKRTKENYFGTFCPVDTALRLVYDYDIVSAKRVKKRTIASLLPLFTDLLDKQQAEGIVSMLTHSHFCNENCAHDHRVATSIPFDEEGFNPLNYWRGPVWINMNWMIYQGLRRYGFNEESAKLKDAMISLVKKHGFYEYYNPSTGQGLGARNFSWTAALLTDLLSEKGSS